MKHPLLLLTLLVAGPMSLADADQLQGRVVDANGNGVANVDIDAFNKSTGQNEVLSNDFTDAQGFFDVVIPAGLFDLTFNPPPPPTTTHLVRTVENVVVVGTTNIGNVALAAGVSLSGTVVTQGGQPVPGVNLDVVDLTTDTKLKLFHDLTGATGAFNIAVPKKLIELQLDATTVQTPLLASKALELNMTGNLALGNVVLPPGFHVTATLVRTNGTPVQGADSDMIDVATGEKILTPGDNSNNQGVVDVVVAAGTYRAEFCPPYAQKLAAHMTADFVVSANKALGTITLKPGFYLSGHVDANNSNGVANVDLDLFDVQTGLEVATCGDNTDQNGDYTFVAPAGTFDVVFTPEVGSGYQTLVVPGFVINGDKTLNATLQSGGGGGATVYCDETQNPNNTADISISTVNSGASSIVVSLSNGPANQFVYLLVGNGQNAVNNPPGAKGSLCIVGGSCLGRYDKDVGQITAGGNYSLDLRQAISNPCQGAVVLTPGATWNFQFWHRQPMGTPATFSSALNVVFQ